MPGDALNAVEDKDWDVWGDSFVASDFFGTVNDVEVNLEAVEAGRSVLEVDDNTIGIFTEGFVVNVLDLSAIEGLTIFDTWLDNSGCDDKEYDETITGDPVDDPGAILDDLDCDIAWDVPVTAWDDFGFDRTVNSFKIFSEGLPSAIPGSGLEDIWINEKVFK